MEGYEPPYYLYASENVDNYQRLMITKMFTTDTYSVVYVAGHSIMPVVNVASYIYMFKLQLF